MKNYELTVLFHPDLEMNLDPAVDKVKKILAQAGAKIIKEENDGKKHLAYSIKGQTFAVFYYVDLEPPADAPLKISGVLNITDEVIRYLLVRADEHRPKPEDKEEDPTSEVKETKETNVEKGEE